MNKKLLLYTLLLSFANSNGICVTPVIGQPFAATTQPSSIAFSPLTSNNTLFAAVTEAGSNTVRVFQVGTSTGIFTEVGGSPFTVDTNPQGVAFSPEVGGKIIFAVTSKGQDHINIFSLDVLSSVITPTSTQSNGVKSPVGIAFSPVFGGNVYAAVANGLSGSNGVAVFLVNMSAGTFTPVPGGTFPANGVSSGVAYSPVINGKLFAAVTSLMDNVVNVYSVDATNGNFTQITSLGSPFGTGTTPNTVAFSPFVNNNLFAAINAQGDNQVRVYSVNTSTGQFTPQNGTPFSTGVAPTAVAYSPVIGTTLLAAVSNSTDNTMSLYNVDLSTGALTPSNVSPLSTDTQPVFVAFSPMIDNAVFLASANATGNTNGDITVYKILFAPLLQSATLNCFTGLVFVTGSGANPDAMITVFADGTPIGTGVADGSGDFSFETTVPITGAQHIITVSQTVGSCTTEQSVGVSTAVPAPTLLSATLLDNRLIRVTGSGAISSAQIIVFADGVTELGSANADFSGNFDFVTTVPMPLGSHAISVEQRNPLTQCLSGQSNSIIVTGCAVLITTPANNSIVFTTTPVIAGFACPNGAVTLQVNSSVVFVGSTVADALGNWAIPVTTPLAPGVHTATATGIDPLTGAITTSTVTFTVLCVSSQVTAIKNKYCI